MSDGITIRFDPNELPARARDAARDADAQVLVGLARIAVHGQAVARSLAPVNTGTYRDSLRGRTIHRPAAVEVKSSLRIAHVIQGGRGPGKLPPPRALAAKLGLDARDAYPVARAIGRRGVPGVDVLELTRRALEPLVDDVRRDIASDIGSLDRRAR